MELEVGVHDGAYKGQWRSHVPFHWSKNFDHVSPKNERVDPQLLVLRVDL